MLFDISKWKIIEEPLIPLKGSSIDMALFAAIFAVCASAVFLAARLKNRQAARYIIQSISAFAFFFVFSKCWCAFRGEVFALLSIGVDEIFAFSFIFPWLIIMVFSIIYGRVYCGWVCPVGAITELCGRITGSTGYYKQRNNKKKIPMYFLLLLFIAVIILISYLTGPKTFFLLEYASVFWGIALLLVLFFVINNPVNDSRLRFLKYVSIAVAGIIALLGMHISGPGCFLYTNEIDYASIISSLAVLLASFFVMRAYCRYLCPFGATYALVSRNPSLKIVKNDKCRSCGRCREVCMVDAVKNGIVNYRECMFCGRCVEACPNKALELKT